MSDTQRVMTGLSRGNSEFSHVCDCSLSQFTARQSSADQSTYRRALPHYTLQYTARPLLSIHSLLENNVQAGESQHKVLVCDRNRYCDVEDWDRSCLLAALQYNTKFKSIRLYTIRYRFNMSQSVRASLPGQCRAESHRFEPRSTHCFTICTLYSKSSLWINPPHKSIAYGNAE